MNRGHRAGEKKQMLVRVQADNKQLQEQLEATTLKVQNRVLRVRRLRSRNCTVGH
jgi:hypothetical protein